MRTMLLSPAIALILGAACNAELHPPDEGPTQVMLAIATVPADVACVRITAAGPGRTVTREVPVNPGGSLTEAFAGLPLGSVVFRGEAFPGECDAVTKSTIATWISQDEAVSVALGRLATVNLTMHRNGRAKVGVEFADEPICSPAGRACKADGDCCSRSCVRGACAAGDGGSAAGG